MLFNYETVAPELCNCKATGCPTMCQDIYVLELDKYKIPELPKIKEEPYWVKLNKKKGRGRHGK